MGKREMMLKTAAKYSPGTYVAKYAAPDFQRMIRAEAAAKPSPFVIAVKKLRLTRVRRHLGQCVCVTCGRVGAWDEGLGGMHTGHFIGSRKFSILFEEDNVAPQCSSCNAYEGGAPHAFRLWMLEVRGRETIERLERLKNTTRQFTREELVDMRIEYLARLKQAKQAMEENE